jgi:hypothetical protein
MANRRWRGYADFTVQGGRTEALMTVCPGNPDQEGRRFRAIMEAAGAKLDKFYIIEAGDLGYHNLRRLVPKSEARAFARFRGERWIEEHRPAVEEYMRGRCEIVPMRDIVSDPSYEERISIIRNTYERGGNAVRAQFDEYINGDIETRAARKEKEGVIIEPWAVKESALDYLCDEYAMRSLMWNQFGLQEIYLGVAVSNPTLFKDCNTQAREIDMTIPKVCAITLVEVKMVHMRKTGRAVPSQTVPAYAKDLGTVLRRAGAFAGN